VGSLQFGQLITVGFASLLPEAKRRMLRRLRDTFFLGTAMEVYLSAKRSVEL
jgi:hypothetical protein